MVSIFGCTVIKVLKEVVCFLRNNVTRTGSWESVVPVHTMDDITADRQTDRHIHTSYIHNN
jgi:hypothetical protein